MVKNFLTLFCALCATSLVAQTEDPNVYLTTLAANGIPSTQAYRQFSCRDKIYAVLEYSNLSGGKHRYSVIWRDPSGKKRENPSYKFPVLKEIVPASDLDSGANHKPHRVWVWIKVHHPTSGNEFSVLQPNFGKDQNLGIWSATAYLDGDLISKIEFTLVCF